MAQPIAATPVLKGEEAAEFISKVHRNAKKPVHLVPTPKLKRAQAFIKKHGTNE